MSEAPAGEDGREEADQRTAEVGGGNGPAGAGGSRDSVTSNSGEGSTQPQQEQQEVKSQTQAQQPPPQPPPQQHQAAAGEDPIEKAEVERNQVKRHVEASPQGRYLRFEDKLGTGQYKVVYRSYDTSMGIEVAWNTVNIKNLPKDEKKRIMNEVRLLQNLEHKNLVQFHGSWVNREREEVIFVTEIMQSGSLMDFIRKVEMIRWRVVKRWARQILRGMHYLHSQDPPIIHRDLKCDNIFINGAAGDIRIGDLGLSTSNTRSEKTMSVLGTPEFMAPELYEEFYTEKVDIYAFGMCMLEMVTKERPYSECVNAAQIYRKVTSQILPSALDRVQNVRARDFIRGCLAPDPDDRPSAMDLLNLPFLKDKNEDEDNTLVMLDPAEAVGGQAPASAGGGGAPGTAAIAPAKIDPSLPGVFHPAHRGTPGLDTIDETVTQGAAAASQQAGSAGGVQQATAAAGASQGQASGSSGSATGADGQGDSVGGSGSSVAPGDTDGDGGEPSRRPSYAAALMSDPVGSEASVGAGNGAGVEAGGSEQGGDVKSGDGTATLPEAASAMKGAPTPAAEEVQQSGGRKIPGNPPYESDEDEDEQENDISHPEGFLRAMPEDESSMRVLELPDGRVQRREEEDEEEEEKAAGVAAAAAAATAAAATVAAATAAAATAAAAMVASSVDGPADNADAAASSLTAPFSAQAPPPSSGAPAPTAAEVAAVAVAAPVSQAPRPPTADPAVFYSAGGRHRPTASGSGAISPETMFPAVGGGNDPAARSDPGMLAVGPAVGLQRARSFSPLEHAPEAPLHSVASMPPMVPPTTTNSAPVTPLTSPPMTPASTVPAPSFPAPRPPAGPPTGNVQFMEKQPPRPEGAQQPDVLGTGNGPGPALQPPALPAGGGEGEKPPVSLQQSDQELQDMLSGRSAGSAARFQTEIKIANLQGPEQEIMRLVMHTHIEGRLQEVEFDFNLDLDHPEQVSAEMIKELGLSDEELGQTSLTITNLAEKARRRRVRRTSSTSSGLIGQIVDGNPGQTLTWTGSDVNIGAGAHRGSQGSGGTASFGSGGGDGPISGSSETADNDNVVGSLAGGVEEYSSDDDLGIEDDDEFRKKKAVHDKKKRQAEKVYEARLAALLAARNDRKDEHKRAQERYKKDCEEFDKKVEKLQGEKERRMEECLDELRGLEDGYRQKHRDAKQAKRAGSIAAQVGMLSAGQPPLEAAPTPQGYAQRQALRQNQSQNQAHATMEVAGGQDNGQMQALIDQSRPRNADIDGIVDDGGGGGGGVGGGLSDQQRQPINLSQFNSSEGQGVGTHWSGSSHDVSAVAGKNPPPTLEQEDAARRDRLSTS